MDFAQIAAKIRVIYPTFLPADNDAAFEIWYDLFKGYDIREVMPLVDNHLRTSVYPPTPADIIPKPKVQAIDANKAWREVLSAVGHFGIYRELEAMDSLPDDVREAVEDVGFRNICMATEAEAKKMFTQAYKENKEKSYALV